VLRYGTVMLPANRSAVGNLSVTVRTVSEQTEPNDYRNNTSNYWNSPVRAPNLWAIVP